MNDGRPVYYSCLPENDFLPDPEQIENLVSSRTRAIVLINPNNPTGAVYSREVLTKIVEIARRHGLMIMADEIYDNIVYDDVEFVPVAPLCGEDVPCMSFGGLSKVHRACGWRVGWAVLSGESKRVATYVRALNLLSALRLCANVPGQFAIEAALNGADTITPLCQPGGRLFEAREAIRKAVKQSPHLELVTPHAAMYAFPSVTGAAAIGFDDHKFALELLEEHNVLISPGSSFNVPYRNHFRLTLLPPLDKMAVVFERIDALLDVYAERNGGRAREVA